MEKELNQDWFEMATVENLNLIINRIGRQRKIERSAEELLPIIERVRQEAALLGRKNEVLKLHTEKYLCFQQMIMEEKSKKVGLDSGRLTRGTLGRASASRTLENYVRENDPDLKPENKAMAYLQLGKYADYTGRFIKSEFCYRQGLVFLKNIKDPNKKVARLEFAGLLSDSILKQGRTDEALRLVNRTLKDFDESGDGKLLKEKKYQYWATWKSGIEIRTAEYILENKMKKYYVPAKQYLEDAIKILVMPNGDREIFHHRRNELKKVKSLLPKNKIKR